MLFRHRSRAQLTRKFNNPGWLNLTRILQTVQVIMPTSIFNTRDSEPTEPDLLEALRENDTLWMDLQEYLRTSLGEVRTEWKYYGVKTGWLLKTFYKKRNLFFCNPQSGYFSLSFIFGQKAVRAVMDSELPEAIKEELRNARQYSEGRGMSLEVRTGDDLQSVKILADIKIRN